jgi:hypothetical protein
MESRSKKDVAHAKTQRWAMEVYRGQRRILKEEVEDDDCIPELNLDEEDTVQVCKVLATIVFYSRKSYNLQYLFSDMLKA